MMSMLKSKSTSTSGSGKDKKKSKDVAASGEEEQRQKISNRLKDVEDDDELEDLISSQSVITPDDIMKINKVCRGQYYCCIIHLNLDKNLPQLI